MNDLKQEEKSGEIRTAIKNSIEDGRNTIQELAKVFRDTVLKLRFEESEVVFTQLVQNIRDLQCVIDFISELESGLKYFEELGMASGPITHQDSGIKLFREINSALETKDWILLSDLVEYELSPLLLKEDEWLGTLDAKLAACVA